MQQGWKQYHYDRYHSVGDCGCFGGCCCCVQVFEETKRKKYEDSRRGVVP